MEALHVIDNSRKLPDELELARLLAGVSPTLAAELRFSLGPLRAIALSVLLVPSPEDVSAVFHANAVAIGVHLTRYVAAMQALAESAAVDPLNDITDLAAIVPAWLLAVMERTLYVDRQWMRFFARSPDAASEVLLEDAVRLASGLSGMFAVMTARLATEGTVEVEPEVLQAVERYASNELTDFNAARTEVLERLCAADTEKSILWGRRIPSGDPTLRLEDMADAAADAYLTAQTSLGVSRH